MRSVRLRNQILSLLPAADFDRLAVGMERVHLPLREVVCQEGDRTEHVYFPVTGVFAAMAVLHDGGAVEASMVGSEGMTSIHVMAGEAISPYRLIQQIEGDSLRVRTQTFLQELEQGARLRTIMQHYSIVVLNQAIQSAACNLRHCIEKRMARWLLVCADRAQCNIFPVTQEFLSTMLGVRRQSINATANQLQNMGLISYRRGKIQLRDRAGLEATACECYAVQREIYERYMKALHA